MKTLKLTAVPIVPFNPSIIDFIENNQIRLNDKSIDLVLDITDEVNLNEIRKAMLYLPQFDYFRCSVLKFKEMQAYLKEDSLKVCENGDLFLFGKDLVVRWLDGL